MAEEFEQAKTEAPTQRRREEAREQGQVAISQDLTGGLLLLVAILGLYCSSGTLGIGLLNAFRADIGGARPYELDPATVQGLFSSLFGQGMSATGFFWILIPVTVIAISLFQTGLQVTPGLLAIQWERISPVRGWEKLFSIAAAMRGLIALLKVLAIGGLAYWVAHGRAVQIAYLGGNSVLGASVQGWGMIMRLALAVGGAMALIGVIDYGYQRWRFEMSLRMTRQELKEELKREEGNPQVRGQIRRLQREAARKHMFRELPKATVVVTNPTHLAVALRYERSTMRSPRVVAKGSGLVAARIVEQARRYAVPIVERKPLAQALFKSVKIGQEIPVDLYRVVAELLAYVYRLRSLA